MKTLTTAMFICKNPAYLFAKIRHADLLGGFLATFAIVTAFAFGAPAHAGDNAFSEWFCGGVSGCDSGGDRSYNLLGEVDLGFITPAHAGRFAGFGDCESGDGSFWCGSSRDDHRLIEDLDTLSSVSIISPAYAGANEDFQCIFSPITGKDCYCNGTCGVLDGVGLITPVPDDLSGSMSIMTPAHAGDWNPFPCTTCQAGHCPQECY
ncbi:MAG: hypothetical protein V6Z81_10640 [Parvularculales bacterium]